MSKNLDSDISLKEFILLIKDYFNELLRSWLFITIMGFLCAFLMFAWKFNTQPLYKANLTFMLNEDESGGLGGLSALMGQFGFSAGATESNLDKILQLSKARTITQNAIFEKATIQDKEDYIANHFIESFDKLNRWKGGGLLSFLASEDKYNIDDFRFTHDSVEIFTMLEKKALKKIHLLLAGNKESPGCFHSEFSDLTGIMEFSVTSNNPDLSIVAVNNLFEKLSSYYVEKSVGKQEYDYNIIRSKYDSITYALSDVQNKLAYVQDSRRDLFRKQERPANAGRFFYFLVGGLLGGFLGCGYVLLRKMYRQIMNA